MFFEGIGADFSATMGHLSGIMATGRRTSMDNTDNDKQRRYEQDLIHRAVAFAHKHGLDPLEAVRDFLDVALICRGSALAVCTAARWN